MKVLLLGSLITASQMEMLNANSVEKASVAPINYETMLVKGLSDNGIQVEALSVPAVAAFPNSKFLHINRKSEILENKINIQWIPFFNVQGMKQLSIKTSVERELSRWLQKNRDVKNKIVLMYSIYPPYTEPAIRLCQKYGCHLSAVIADLPEYMYSWKNMSGLRGWYSKRLSNKMLELQGKCDSYILFTKPMASKMGIANKPFIVSEGFCDESVFFDIPDQEKYQRKTVLYGGNLSRLYGIQDLVKGFMQTDIDAELHIYGAGADADFVEACSKKDSRIKFFGRVDRRTLLIALKKAHLLVVNKPTTDDYSNYSFSSKILEYMSSGTPVLTTRVGGMPNDYFHYMYFIDDETVTGIANAIEKVLSIDLLSLSHKGEQAKEFAIEKKNYYQQTKLIQRFLENNCEQIRER